MDQELKAALLDRFQVRKTAAQKRAFREYVQEYCREAGLSYADWSPWMTAPLRAE